MSQHQVEPEDLVKDNSYAVIFEKPKDPKLIRLISGNKLQTNDGAAFRHMNFIN
jgi:hypothetical protein